jgi:hypothetical protein
MGYRVLGQHLSNVRAGELGNQYSSPCKHRIHIDRTTRDNDTVSRTSTAVTRRDDYRDNVNPGTQSASDEYLYGIRVELGDRPHRGDLGRAPLRPGQLRSDQPPTAGPATPGLTRTSRNRCERSAPWISTSPATSPRTSCSTARMPPRSKPTSLPGLARTSHHESAEIS